jgi:hypothetical protein
MTDSERRWERGWDGHDQAQRERRAALPFAVKLQWLEDAHRLVVNLRPTASRPPDAASHDDAGAADR